MAITAIQSSSGSLALGSGKARAAASYDSRDTNRDGIVSPAEALAYDLRHPNLSMTGRKSAPLQEPVGSRRSDLAANPLVQADRSSSAYVDPRDTNRNGTVSPLERQAYDLRHPLQEVSLGPAQSTYAPRTSRNAGMADRSRVLDLYA